MVLLGHRPTSHEAVSGDSPQKAKLQNAAWLLIIYVRSKLRKRVPWNVSLP